MKVGLITFHDTTNFGSLLQTYGLYKSIVDLGYDCDVIDYQCENIINREIPKPLKFHINPWHFFLDLYFGGRKRKKYRELHSFLENNMTLSEKCDKTTIASLGDKYDKFIIGSDIVWGMDITGGDLTYFLDFLKDRHKKYAFASSIGNPWSYREKEVIRPLLKDFAYISVRENESAEWVEELTGERPPVVCDPTMLVPSSEWKKLVYPRLDSGKYVFVYFDNRNGDCKKSAYKYAKYYGLKVVEINYLWTRKGVDSERAYSLSDFLSLIYNAAMVVTASYHGLLFSIYFNKRVVYYNRAHKSRMNTLANNLMLDNANGEGHDILNMPNIDYSIVNSKVDGYRLFSMNCLKQLLIS